MSAGNDPTFTISAEDLAEIRTVNDRAGSIGRVLFEELDATHDALRAEHDRWFVASVEASALRARLALAERLADAASDLANVSKPSATADKVVGLVAEWDRGRGGEK